jgi:hypothetical protein
MRVVLRTVRGRRAAGRPGHRQAVFDAAIISIGRGADQLIQICDSRLSVAHAVIEQRGGALSLRALTEHSILVNGSPQRRAALARGDVLSLANATLRVEDVRADGVIVLRLDLPAEGAIDPALAADARSLKEAGMRAAPAAWALGLSVLALALLWPLMTSLNTPLRAPLRNAPLVPSDALWQPGSLHTAHQSIGGDCNACHGEAFDRVADRACGSCHPGTQHHVPQDSPARARFASMHCADCHVEHARPSRLVDLGSRPCIGCHANLSKFDPQTSLQDVSDFGGGHPDFSLAMLEPVRVPVSESESESESASESASAPGRGSGPGDADLVWRTRMIPASFRPKAEEHSNLKFSHKVHMDGRGIKSPDGEQVLTCADCHRTDAGGRHMAPIRMEQHCARCHSLQFDEHDAATAVPHGSLKLMVTALEAHFSRMFLYSDAGAERRAERRRPGGEQTVISRDEQRRALEWTTRESLQAAHELLEKRVCVECHTVVMLPGATGFDRWRVEPVKLASSWMPRAQFSHTAHRSSTCITCHVTADTSRSSSDVLMPHIGQCQVCHGGSHDGRRLASDCGMCHRLHVPGTGGWVPVPAKGTAAPITASASGVP